MFLKNQTQQNQEDYVSLLKSIGALSKLFSENKAPYLNYRAHENIFCKAFEASNESRGDVSVDAVKGNIGIGLKTFLFKNSQFEKIAEFNKLMPIYSNLSGIELINAISTARNERINLTTRLYGLEESLYHCVARDEKRFIVYEENMPLIQTEAIGAVADDGKIINFNDGISEYKFNRSKSTLFKKFIPSNELDFEISVLDDPYTAILNLYGSGEEATPNYDSSKVIILPLYSTNSSGDNFVPEKSGLNQWNASGRARSYDEVYIPIPAWIHRSFSGFLPPRDQPFDVTLPDNSIMSSKVCQDGGKALMSNPNSVLGEWILRKVLHLKEGELLTYGKLLQVGIDSVALYKNSVGNFTIQFKQIGTYDEFKDSNVI